MKRGKPLEARVEEMLGNDDDWVVLDESPEDFVRVTRRGVEVVCEAPVLVAPVALPPDEGKYDSGHPEGPPLPRMESDVSEASLSRGLLQEGSDSLPERKCQSFEIEERTVSAGGSIMPVSSSPSVSPEGMRRRQVPGLFERSGSPAGAPESPESDDDDVCAPFFACFGSICRMD